MDSDWFGPIGVVLPSLPFIFRLWALLLEFEVSTNDGSVFTVIPAGTFTMGTTEEQRANVERKTKFGPVLKTVNCLRISLRSPSRSSSANTR